MGTIQNQIRILLVLLASIFIASCSSSSGGSTDIAPTITLISPADGSTLTAATPIIIRFDQSMTPGSLSLTGLLASESNSGVWSTTTLANDTLTLTPTLTWRHGLARTLGLDAQNTNAISLAQAMSLTYDVNNPLQRVNVGNTGNEAILGHSEYPSISSDGRYVAYQSNATNLVPGGGDTNVSTDIFVRDRNTNTTTRVSVATGGAQATGGSSSKPSISADGRYVAFSSLATDLVGSDTNATTDIFVHDRLTGATTRVSVVTGGAQATGSSGNPSISADGRFVAFESVATDLVAGDTNTTSDIFVHDRDTNTTTRVSVVTGGAEATGGSSFNTSISADGRYVTFQSSATNLVASDTNAATDIFVHDRGTDTILPTTTRVSVITGGAQANGSSNNPSISADGRYVAFESGASNLVAGDTNTIGDIFVHDRNTNTTTRVSVATGGAQATDHSGNSSISADGRYVAFQSSANDLVGGDGNVADDVFVHDRNTSTTTRVSVATGGAEADDDSYNTSISPDGRYIVFESLATDLVGGDINGYSDIFVTPTLY